MPYSQKYTLHIAFSAILPAGTIPSLDTVVLDFSERKKKPRKRDVVLILKKALSISSQYVV